MLRPLLKPIYAGYSRRVGASHFPVTLDIELTNNCNLGCLMCSRSLMQRKVGYMDMGVLNKIIQEAKQHPIKSIGLHLFGEPLMHPGLIPIIKFIKQNAPSPQLILSTNAYFLSPETAQEIIDTGLDVIRFSIDGADAGTYEKIRPGSNFNRIVGNIREFIRRRDLANTGKPVIQAQIIGMEETKKQILSFKEAWRPLLKKNDQIIVQEFMTFAGRVNDRTSFKVASLRDRLKRRLPCLRLWKNLVIYWDGRVSVCCYDYDGELLVGDINKETIRQIWNGRAIGAMRRAHLQLNKSQFSLCRSCIKQRNIKNEN